MVQWPKVEHQSLSIDDIEKHLISYSEKNLFYSERAVGKYKYEMFVSERGYPKGKGTMFGLSPSKNASLKKFLSVAINATYFESHFQELCFSRPFYVGKANNLRRRLAGDHFKGKSQIIKAIQDCGIVHSDIWIGFKVMPDPDDKEINVILEEIFSRRALPGLTIKPN